MWKQIAFTTVIFAAFLTADPAFAQATANPAPEHRQFYRLDFTIKQLEGGRTINSRNYSMLLQGGQHQRSSIRSGTKLPFRNGNTEEQVDVGLNIDCWDASEVDGQLDLHIMAELSSVAENFDSHSGELPLLRQNRWESEVAVPLRKPTTIFSSDDLASKQNVQLEVLATPVR